jgi:hypothetical protein
VPFADTVYTDELLERRTTAYAERAPSELVFDLGAWFSGLTSFLDVYDRSIAESDQPHSVTRDRTTELHITQSGLFTIGELLRQVRKDGREEVRQILDAKPNEMRECASVIGECAMLNQALLDGKTAGFAEWRSWRVLLAEKLSALAIAERFETAMAEIGPTHLPLDFPDLMKSREMPANERAAITSVTARLGRIIRLLQIIGRMLKHDEPLKPGVLIFCGIYEQTRALIEHTNNLLTRFSDDQSEVFALLDGASYMASLELKKAYFQELTGIVALRPAPAIFARFETAYSLLNDSLRQILTSFVRMFDPEMDPSGLFPEFKQRLDDSLVLRSHLARVLSAVQAAEQKPEERELETLDAELQQFLAQPLGFLFYKDRESFERFCEEIPAAGDKKDLVSILHRFAAYVETLLRQVNMRAVLANHPFEGGAIKPDPGLK